MSVITKELETKIKTFPETTQHVFFNFFDNDNYERFKYNALYNCIVQHTNNLTLTGTNEEFKKYFVSEGLKMLLEKLCTMYTNVSGTDVLCTNALCTDGTTNSYILTQYFRIIYSLVTTMNVYVIGDMLLSDFKQYFNISTIETDSETSMFSKKNVFDRNHDCRLSFVEILKEKRTGDFENCSGTIVLFNNSTQDKPYFLIYDILNKQIFIKNVCRGGGFDTNITLPNLELGLGIPIENTTSEQKCAGTCTGTGACVGCGSVFICCWNVCGALSCAFRVLSFFI